MKTRFTDFINENSDYETFEEWFDIFTDQVSHLGYNGPIMDDTFIEDWENEKCPYESAEEFVQEMNEKIINSNGASSCIIFYRSNELLFTYIQAQARSVLADR